MADLQPTRTEHDAHSALNGGYSSTVERVVVGSRGELEIEICEQCRFIQAECAHSKNTWDRNGKNLTCDLCGIDGT